MQNLIIPTEFENTELTRADIRRLSIYLKTWEYTAKVYQDFTLSELEKAILIELNYKQRQSVLDRLIGRYAKEKRKHISRQLKEAIGGEFQKRGAVSINSEISEIIENAA